VENPEEKTLLGRAESRWADNNKAGDIETGFVGTTQKRMGPHTY